MGMRYLPSGSATWQMYIYDKNLQGDIVAVYNTSGTKLVSYKYDAWGNCTVSYLNGGASTAAANNPFRYRGYYYDSEIGLYYLQSRYYDATVGRFLNADTPEQAVVSVGVFYINIFSYCSNKVTNNLDYSGEAFLTALLIGFAVGAVISGVSTIVKNKKKGKKWYDGLAISMLAGGVGGAISCITIPGVSTWVCAAVFGALGNLTTQVILGEIKSLSDVTSAILAGAAAGLLGNAAAKALNKFVSARFVKWTKSQQKNFLGKIGMITNRTLRDIRQAIKKNGGYKVIENAVSKVLDRYGYPTVVSAFVSSTATSV